MGACAENARECESAATCTCFGRTGIPFLTSLDNRLKNQLPANPLAQITTLLPGAVGSCVSREVAGAGNGRSSRKRPGLQAGQNFLPGATKRILPSGCCSVQERKK